MKNRTKQNGLSSANNACTFKPWLNDEGKNISDVELKSISAYWSAETWEAFLSSTVDKNISHHETVLADYESLLEQETETIWESHFRLPEAVHKKVHQAVNSQGPVARKIIRGLIFHEIPEKFLAKKLGMHRQNVNRTKNLSLKKIEQLLRSDDATSSYLIGGSANLPLKAQTREQELHEVYLADLKGSYMK